VILLSDEQRAAVEKGDAVRVTASELGKEVVVLRADMYESIKDLLEETKRKVIAEAAMENALGREKECL
jgi:ASC-1-like (ASCH) protein